MPTVLRRRRTARWTAAVIAAVLAAAVALLAGCASDQGGESSAEAPRRTHAVGSGRTPSVGDCWQEPDYEAVKTWSSWQGSVPVDCAAEHNSITAVVRDLPADFASPWTDAGERRDLTDEEFGVVRRTCVEGLGADIGLREGSRATWFWYLPSPRQWDAGERWLRCDVAVIALGPLSPTVVEPLPAEVADVLDGAWDAPAYLLCIDTPYPAPDHFLWDDPDTNVAVPCDGQSQWHFGTSATFDGTEPPTHDEVLDRLEHYCFELVGLLPRRTSAVIYFPNEETWAEGTRTAKCWIY